MDQPELIPLSEACVRLHLSREKVRRQIEAGRLEGAYVDGRWFVAACALPPEAASRFEEVAA